MLVAKCVVDFALARTPSWQLAQLPEMPSCVKPVAGVHAVVAWQLLHSVVVGMCVAPLPVAVVPLWQLEHEPTTCA